MYAHLLARTLRTHDGGAALSLLLLHDAVLPDRLDERTDVEVAHQHPILTRAV